MLGSSQLGGKLSQLVKQRARCWSSNRVLVIYLSITSNQGREGHSFEAIHVFPLHGNMLSYVTSILHNYSRYLVSSVHKPASQTVYTAGRDYIEEFVTRPAAPQATVRAYP